MTFKGTFRPTVIRKPLSSSEETGKNQTCKDDDGLQKDIEPKYTVKYRHNITDIPTMGDRVHSRPNEVVVDILLPEFTSTKCLDLDITDKGLTLVTSEPVSYNLNLKFSYPVLEEKAAAKFDKSSHNLNVIVPIKPDLEVKRLTSTDSGIDVDTGYFELDDLDDQEESNNDSATEDVETSTKALFPAYTCNIYEEVMIFTLDVNNVSENSLIKSSMSSEDFGFSLKFDSMGPGCVPFEYTFFCALQMDFVHDQKPFNRAFDPLEHLEVEVWDNNVIVKVTLPDGAECVKYKVGSNPTDLTIHSLPQLKALRKRHEQLIKNVKTCSDESLSALETNKGLPTKPDDESNQFLNDKERHSSGDSQDSLLCSPPDATCVEVILEDTEELRSLKSILKSRKQRCFSESQKDLMSWKSNHSHDQDSIPEEDEDNAFSEGCLSKKSVTFSEVVQKHVFRPTSTILGMTQKNLKKKQAKIRRAERRASEGDVHEMDKIDPYEIDDEANNDSGVASSVEETSTAINHNRKSKRNKKNKMKNNSSANAKRNFLSSTAANDLIFDLDDV